ncbi:MAG TPA: hypothetical protein VMN60_02155 [Longimicrobiales bacterium]|nr:hypothetical protein [Longimicrobiales bacterium]
MTPFASLPASLTRACSAALAAGLRLRGIVPRASRVAGAAAPAMLLAACLDFADPDIPNKASPAVLQVTMRVFDSGVFQVDGSLLPGRDSAGFQRVVQSPFILAAGILVEPRTLGERGQRSYSHAVVIPRNDTGGPFDMIAPDVRDAGTLPAVRMVGINRVGPDTLVVAPGQDVLLRMDTLPLMSVPSTRSQQWFLDIRSGTRVFRISSDGPPPATLRIPSDFIPPSPDGRAFVGMVYFQTVSVRSETGSYIGNIMLDVRLNWVIDFESAP